VSPQPIQLPLRAMTAGFRRFSVAEYERLTELGLLTEDDNLELIEGYLVHKMARNPPHDGTLQEVGAAISAAVPAGWIVRDQKALTLPDSVPEPDLAVVRRDPGRYMTRHPNSSDAGLIVEVADSTVDSDRIDKGRIYARANIPTYWIINIPDRQIEVYTSPSGPTAAPAYASRQDFKPGQDLPLVLDGAVVAHLPVAALLP
jgi:Uma2 family endonuclease